MTVVDDYCHSPARFIVKYYKTFKNLELGIEIFGDLNYKRELVPWCYTITLE